VAHHSAWRSLRRREPCHDLSIALALCAPQFPRTKRPSALAEASRLLRFSPEVDQATSARLLDLGLAQIRRVSVSGPEHAPLAAQRHGSLAESKSDECRAHLAPGIRDRDGRLRSGLVGLLRETLGSSATRTRSGELYSGKACAGYVLVGHICERAAICDEPSAEPESAATTSNPGRHCRLFALLRPGTRGARRLSGQHSSFASGGGPTTA